MGYHRPIAIGRIDYANAWPLFHRFDSFAGSSDYEIVSRYPAELNRLLQAGELDISAISSYSYGLNANDYVLMPELSVGSTGNVHSILLFMKQPIEAKRPSKIALTTTSATSANLLKIMMAMYYECSPEYAAAEPRLADMLQDADAALLIGDPAIQASWSRQGLHVIDLGRLWNEWTGLGMTYAVVAARKQAIAAAPAAVEAAYAALLKCKQHNQHHLEPLIVQACEQLGGNAAYWDMYFHSLQYDFGDKLQEGLALYFRYAKQLGLLDKDVRFSFFERQSAQKVKE